MENLPADNANAELDLAEVMARIRRDAQKRKLESFNNASSLPAQSSDLRRLASLRQVDPLPADLKMQAELERRAEYKLGYLLGFHDEVFIRNAYQVILKREPDDAGFAQFLKDLRSGRYSKIDILRSLRFSAEGRKAGVKVEGLTPASVFRKIYRVPVVGYVAQLVTGMFRLPVLIANYRRLETHTAAQLDRVADHLNEVAAYFAEANQRQAEVNRRQLETIQAQFTAHQQQLDAVKTNFLLQLETLVREHEKFVQEQNSVKADFAARLDASAEQVREQLKTQELQAAELQTLNAQLDEHMQALAQRLQNIRLDVAQQENRLGKVLGDDTGVRASFPSVQPQTFQVEQDHLLDSLYRSLEDGLRGTSDEIKDELKGYLPILQAAEITENVLDVGCGRGEWLEVLREANIQATGVDNNRVLIKQCREMNLDVVEAEALAYLRSLKDRALSAITAFHFAEHLPLQEFVNFLDEAGRTLKPNGLLILETPNPENLLVGSCNFYLDPTHKNPIPIPTMKLLVEARGFQCEEVMRLHPVPNARIEVKDQLTSHLNHFLYGPMNYAVVARKPEQA
ncbi:MAG TPA: methyltransferase domain-containing protein [Pyrinomonadaceae bacterium]|nr:methyltransferase domain-containing protein [Pyrinomonadaceae bacterium]